MPLSDLTILFAGSGAFGVPSLARLLDRGARIATVYTQPDKPAGRGNRMTPTPVATFAGERGLNVIRTADLNAEQTPGADLLVVIAFGQKLGPDLIARPRLGAINLHASRLPRYRGAAPIHWAVINGDPTAGNSVIRLAERMDAGRVLGMSELPVGELETTGELHDRLAADGADLIEQVATELAEGRSSEVEQDHAAATRAPKLSREASAIDWSRDARSIANQIRGMHPWPGCRVRLLDSVGSPVDRLTLVRARPLAPGLPGESPASRESLDVGTISPGKPGAKSVLCGTGELEVVELQPDGKRPMPLDAYRRGHRWEPGMRLEPVTT